MFLDSSAVANCTEIKHVIELSRDIAKECTSTIVEHNFNLSMPLKFSATFKNEIQDHKQSQFLDDINSFIRSINGKQFRHLDIMLSKVVQAKYWKRLIKRYWKQNNYYQALKAKKVKNIINPELKKFCKDDEAMQLMYMECEAFDKKYYAENTDEAVAIGEFSLVNAYINNGFYKALTLDQIQRGLGSMYKGEGYLFATLTLPPEYHPNPKKGKNSWNGSTMVEAYRELLRSWKNIRTLLDKKKVHIAGIKGVEPHGDGCPHMHIAMFCYKEDLQTVKDVIKECHSKINHESRAYELVSFTKQGKQLVKVTERPNETKAKILSLREGKTEADFDDVVQAFTGYTSKYVMKNACQLKDIESEDGKTETALQQYLEQDHSEKYWASTLGIRAYEVFGLGKGVKTKYELAVKLSQDRDNMKKPYPAKLKDVLFTAREHNFAEFTKLANKLKFIKSKTGTVLGLEYVEVIQDIEVSIGEILRARFLKTVDEDKWEMLRKSMIWNKQMDEFDSFITKSNSCGDNYLVYHKGAKIDPPDKNIMKFDLAFF